MDYPCDIFGDCSLSRLGRRAFNMFFTLWPFDLEIIYIHTFICIRHKVHSKLNCYISSVGYPKIIPYIKFEHFGITRFWVIVRKTNKQNHTQTDADDRLTHATTVGENKYSTALYIIDAVAAAAAAGLLNSFTGVCFTSAMDCVDKRGIWRENVCCSDYL